MCVCAYVGAMNAPLQKPSDRARKPDWIRVKAPTSPGYAETRKLMRDLNLHTVCEEAACPNIGECWKQKHATVMILGSVCTRACSFCNVATGRPDLLDPHEPAHVAEAVGKLGLQHIVVTSVDRDDLADGGAQAIPASPPLPAADFAVAPELSADGTAISAVDIDAASAPAAAAEPAPLPDVAPPNAFLARASCWRGMPRHESLANRNIRMLMRRGLVVRDEQLPLIVTRSRTSGEGAVGLQVLNEQPYKFNVGVNNSGMTTTGKMQGTANLLMKNPLGMYGQFNTTVSQDLQNARRDAMNRDLTANYSVPLDSDWTVGIRGSTNTATDQIAAGTTQTQTLQWRVRRAFDVTSNGTTGIELRYNRSRTEDPNAIHTYDSYAEVGLSHTHYLGTSKLDLSVMQRLNAPWMPSSAGPPGWSYRFQSIDAKLTVPF